MADEKKSGEKSIEMRLAEIEDKLAKLHVTEEELRAYHKVSSMLGGGAPVEPQAAPTGGGGSIPPCIMPRYIPRYINRSILPRINRGINECNECGPCEGGGGWGGGWGGGFGGFGA